MELHPKFTDEDWRNELRRNILYSGQENQPVCFLVDEYRIVKDEWFKDVACLLKTGMHTEIVRKNDIFGALVNIRFNMEKRLRLGLSFSNAQVGD